jgi:undecaprenyl-diphosphatase
METWQAILLGLIQGLTEFLPISSSGHLELGRVLLGIDGEQNLTFTVALHGATVLSTIAALWREVWKILRGLFAWRWNWETEYVVKIVISMIPVAIVGFLFKEQLEVLFTGNLLLVGVMLLLTAFLLMLTNRPVKMARIHHQPTYATAFVMGIAQAVAVLPGLSRSGSTIATGILMGLDRPNAARFSFLMVLPPIIGMNLLEILTGDLSTAMYTTLPFWAGVLTAFASGYLACRWMLSLVRRGRLVWFAIYCALVGVIAIVAAFFNA